MKSLLFFFTALTFLLPGFAATYDSGDIPARQYRAALQELAYMLEGKAPLSYERALFCIENAFHDNQLDSLYYRHMLDTHTRRIRKLMDANRDYAVQNFRPSFSESITLQQERYERALANWAIFAYMTDTTYISGQYAHLPFRYSFQDPLGTLDWTHTQVSTLLSRGTGNCFALASLFRIFSERLDSEAALCTAPGHIYIRHADHKGVYYNTEVATRSFAGTGSIATLTYTTDEAIRSGIALRPLDTKQSVALCLVYLAKGYLYSQTAPDDTFVMDCARLALHYDSLCLSALLLKAEALENCLLLTHRTPDQWRGDKNFAELESLIRRLYQLGYRQMPLSMKEIIIGRLRKDSTAMRIGATDHTPQPFRAISTEQIPYATLSWGRLEEMHADKPVERYGRTLFDTRNARITGFARDSVFFNDYFFDPVVFAWQIDPLAHKYPSLSPYHAFANNPILYIDEDGREPARNKSGTIQQAIAQWTQNKKTTSYDIMKYIQRNKDAIRYIYTEDVGWIDLQHYFGAIIYGEIAMDALETVAGSKIMQDFFFGEGADKSYYSYEDLPSNAFGGKAPVYDIEMEYDYIEKSTIPKQVLKKGESLFEAIEQHFTEARATIPQNAPNWNQIPFDDQERNRLPNNYTKKDLNSGKYVPQNHSETPYNLENFPPATSSIETTSKSEK